VKRCRGKGFETEAGFGAAEYAWEKLRLSEWGRSGRHSAHQCPRQTHQGPNRREAPIWDGRATRIPSQVRPGVRIRLAPAASLVRTADKPAGSGVAVVIPFKGLQAAIVKVRLPICGRLAILHSGSFEAFA
jgi:hypothetical protein